MTGHALDLAAAALAVLGGALVALVLAVLEGHVSS